MAKLTTERLKEDIALLQEFRSHLQRFQSHRESLKQLKEKVEGNWMMGMDLNAADSMQRDLVSQLMAERQEIARRLHDVTEITSRYPLRTQLVIMPPPLIGGYSSKMNLFEAFIQLQLPHDFQMDPLPVYDVVDQAIWACERQLRDAEPAKDTTQKPDQLREPDSQAAQNSGESTTSKGFGILAGLASIIGLIGLIALCPKPNIDRDITLDERNPFEVQFRVHNGSPWFELYNVSPACEILKAEIGNLVLPKGALVQSGSAPDRLQAGGSSTFPCHLTPEFKIGAEQAYKSAEVSLIVHYKWFNTFAGSVTQRVVLTALRRNLTGHRQT